MQSAWRVVDCTSLDGSLTYVRGRLVVNNRVTGEIVEIPLAETAVLLIVWMFTWVIASMRCIWNMCDGMQLARSSCLCNAFLE